MSAKVDLSEFTQEEPSKVDLSEFTQEEPTKPSGEYYPFGKPPSGPGFMLGGAYEAFKDIPEAFQRLIQATPERRKQIFEEAKPHMWGIGRKPITEPELVSGLRTGLEQTFGRIPKYISGEIKHGLGPGAEQKAGEIYSLIAAPWAKLSEPLSLLRPEIPPTPSPELIEKASQGFIKKEDVEKKLGPFLLNELLNMVRDPASALLLATGGMKMKAGEPPVIGPKVGPEIPAEIPPEMLAERMAKYEKPSEPPIALPPPETFPPLDFTKPVEMLTPAELRQIADIQKRPALPAQIPMESYLPSARTTIKPPAGFPEMPPLTEKAILPPSPYERGFQAPPSIRGLPPLEMHAGLPIPRKVTDWFSRLLRPSGTFPKELREDYATWKRTISEIAPEREREILSIFGKYKDKPMEYTQIVNAVKDPQKLQELIDMKDPVAKDALRINEIWNEEARGKGVEEGLIPKELYEKTPEYIRTQYLRTEAKKASRTELEEVLSDPDIFDISEINAIQDLLTGGGKGGFAYKGGKGEGKISEETMDFLKKRGIPSQEAVEWLGGKLPAEYSLASGSGQIITATAYKALANRIVEKGLVYPDYQPGRVNINEIKGQGAMTNLIRKTLQGEKNKYIDRGTLEQLNDIFVSKGEILKQNKILQGLHKIMSKFKSGLIIYNPAIQAGNAIFSKLLSWTAYGPMKTIDRISAQKAIHDPNWVGRRASDIGGIMQSSMEAEMGAGFGQRPSFVEYLRERSGVTKPPGTIKKIALKAHETYAGVDLKAKLQIFFRELRDRGYEIGDKSIVNPAGRPLRSFKDFDKTDIADFQSAGNAANYYMVDYSLQPKLIQYARETVFPFATFFSNIVPRLLKLGAGIGHDGKFNAGRLARFWAIPGILGTMNELSKQLIGMTPEETKEARAALPEYYRSVPRALTPVLPYRVDEKGKIHWFSKEKELHPAFLPTTRIVPLANVGQQLGEAKIPAPLMPSGPWAGLGEIAVNRRAFAPEKPIVSPDLPPVERRLMQAKEVGKTMFPFPAQTAEKIKMAIKGEAKGRGMQPETIPQAIFNILSPLKPQVVNIKKAEAYKKQGLENIYNNWMKEVLNKAPNRIQIYGGEQSPKYQRWLANERLSLVRRMRARIKSEYPGLQQREDIKRILDNLDTQERKDREALKAL